MNESPDETRLSWRQLMQAAGAAAPLAGLSGRTAAAADAPPSKRMDMVIITTDDNDAESLGRFGCSLHGVTPNMDKLPADGARFTQAYTTSPIFRPRRLSLMTGRYPPEWLTVRKPTQ